MTKTYERKIWQSTEGRLACEKHLGGYATMELKARPTVKTIKTPLDSWKICSDAEVAEFEAEYWACETCHFEAIHEAKMAADTRTVVPALDECFKDNVLDLKPFFSADFEGYFTRGGSYMIAFWEGDVQNDLALIVDGRVEFIYPDHLNCGVEFIGSLNRMF